MPELSSLEIDPRQKDLSIRTDTFCQGEHGMPFRINLYSVWLATMLGNVEDVILGLWVEGGFIRTRMELIVLMISS